MFFDTVHMVNEICFSSNEDGQHKKEYERYVLSVNCMERFCFVSSLFLFVSILLNMQTYTDRHVNILTTFPIYTVTHISTQKYITRVMHCGIPDQNR